MSKIAVIKTGGKQYKVKEGDDLKIEKLKADVGAKVDFETLLIADEEGKDMQVGTPSLGEKVKGEILEHGKGKKITVVKFKWACAFILYNALTKNDSARELFILFPTCAAIK